MKKRILVKVGTNVLSRKNRRLDYNRISDLVDQICTLKEEYQIILVSSGAQGAGLEFFEFQNEPDPLIRKQMLASVGQARLFQVYFDFFREQSVTPAQALITRNDFNSKISFQNIKTTLEGLLDNGIVPIINENDVVSLRESSFGDNDQLAALTAGMMRVDLLVILSDIEGFFTADPKTNPDAELIRNVDQISPELLSLCEDSLSTGGTGGMYSKLKAAQLATEYGIPTIVTSGLTDQGLIKAVKGKTSGTHFHASKRKEKSDHGNWMLTGASVQGTITIDDGAQKALIENKSLLAVGICNVEGPFEKKEVVLIQNKSRIRVGVGLTNFASSEIQELIRPKIKPQGVVVIHKSHLYTL